MLIRRAHLALYATTFSGCAATGLPDQPILKPYELPERVFPLKSGLRVIVQEDRSSPLVVVTSTFAVGSTADPTGVEGLAHVVEHLAFRAQPGGGPKVWDTLKRTGASFNAFTTPDVTSYYEIAHKDNLKDLMQMEALRLWRTLEGVTPEVFATEREVVRNELRQRGETNVGNRMFGLVFEALFPPGHPLHRSVAGSHESLSKAALADAQAFVKQHYKPENCTMVIAGDVNGEEVGKLLGTWPAEILFGPGGPEGDAVPPNKPFSEWPARDVPPPYDTTLKKHKGPVTQPELILAWSVPGAFRHNTALIEFATGRLNLALIEGLAAYLKDDDDIEGASAFSETLADASVIFVGVGLKPGADPEKAKKRILDTLVNAWTTELGRLLTEATRWYTASDLLLDSADPVGKAIALASHMGATGGTQLFKETFDELAEVAPGTVRDFAYKWLQRERAVAVYFEPENDLAPALASGGGGGDGTRRTQHDVGHDNEQVSADLGAARILQVALAPGIAQLPRFTLPNGLEVVTVKRSAAPIAQISVELRGGDATSSPYGLAGLASRFSRSMCHDHGELSPVGGSSGEWTGRTVSGFSARVPSGNLANGLAILGDEMRCQEASEEAFLSLGRVMDIQTKFYERRQKRPEYIAAKLFWAALYPNHPFGIDEADPAALRKVQFADAAAYVRNHYKPENATAVVFGDVEPGEVKALSEKYLAMWNGGGARAPGPAIPPASARPEKRKIFLVDRPGATQATVDVGCRLADAKPERLPAYDVLEALANEKAWLLREIWGATYGVHASTQAMPGGAAHLAFNGAVENAQAGAAVGKLLQMVGELAEGNVDEPLFLTKRWDVAREFSRRFATASGLAEGVLDAVRHGWPNDVWDRYPANLAATERATLREISVGCAGNEIVTVVGDAAKLRPGLEKAGLSLSSN